MANPASTLASQWPYYIQPAEQTPEVQAQLDALIQTRMDEDGGSLNPETITVLDPACGSGYILVVAYDVLKAIYLERGYQPRAIPRLILEKNLYGLDIDDRAAQMAGFALLMKARADDRRLFNEPPKLNVLALQESKGMDADEIVRALGNISDVRAGFKPAPTIFALIDTFAHAKTFGSLIQIPPALSGQLPVLTNVIQQALQSGDLYQQAAAQDLLPLVRQALVLGMQFDAVVANPPYMGSKGMNSVLKDFARSDYSESKADLFAMFMERGFVWCKHFGFNGMVTMQSWMFLSSYQEMREKLLQHRCIYTMAHLGARAFGEISGEVVQTTAFVLQPQSLNYKPTFFRLIDGAEADKELALRAGNLKFETVFQEEFQRIPGSPLAYWVSENSRSAYAKFDKVADFAETRIGLITGENQKYIRFWYEVAISTVGFDFDREGAKRSNRRWFPQSKGGDYKRWYGNNETVVDWKNDGLELQTRLHSSGERTLAHNFNLDKIFQSAITWTKISSGDFAVRLQPQGFLFNDASANAFVDDDDARLAILGFLGTKLPGEFLKALNPTLNFLPGNIASLPVPATILKSELLLATVKRLVDLARFDWDSFEVSWDFKTPWWGVVASERRLPRNWTLWAASCKSKLNETQSLEVQNNRLYIEAYDLQDELSPEVPESQITLARADREKDCQRLISYAIGCMMGRYSLDEPGLIYAHAGNVGFDASRYASFHADADGIVPLTDELWFTDDAASRMREFLLAVWGDGAGDSPSPQPSPQRGEGVNANMAWLAESLGTKASETPDETIRRYLSDKFFKDHLKTYKKRPIYWLFSSGKQGAFQALVYLHRYNEGTLARLRAEYVVPLTGKLQARIVMLQKDLDAASSTAARNKLNKEIEKLKKKHVELLAYDEQLRHYADMRITLDLDDGVKVNYGKFGDLLAEVKAVTGGAGDE